jgi:hypothetical protein
MKSQSLGFLKYGAVIALTLFVISTPAHAIYKYEYTGNVFSTTWTPEFKLGEMQPFSVNTVVTAEVFSPALLTSGSGLTNGLTFSLMTQTSPSDFAETMTYPFPYPYPPSFNFQEEGIFNIGAIDASGLPTRWNISIERVIAMGPGADHRTFSTSNDLDIVAGGYEGYIHFAGSIANKPGKWTVSAVPEPGIYAMLLAGLGLIGFAARKCF